MDADETDQLICTGKGESHAAYLIKDSTRDALDDAFSKLVATRPTLSVNTEPYELLHAAGIICRTILSEPTKRILQQFGTGGGSKVLFFENLPQQPQLPPTPCESGFLAEETEVLFADAIQFGLLSTMCLTPIAHAHENQQKMFRNVSPTIGAKDARSSHGSNVPFGDHSDNPNSSFIGEQQKVNWPPVPPVLAFYGLRNEDLNGRAVPTSIIPLVDIMRALDDETRIELRQPHFSISAPASNDDAGTGNAFSIKAAILVEDPVHGDCIRFDANVTTGLTEEAEIALAALAVALRRGKGRLDFQVRGGCTCYFWNTQVLHQRQAFSPGPLEVARWLRRCYATPDIYAGHIPDKLNHPLVWGVEKPAACDLQMKKLSSKMVAITA